LITFTNHVFATLTFSRGLSSDLCWRKTSIDFNRFIQRVRRLHKCEVQYIRVVEAHRDSYPHLHAVIQFPTSISVSNARRFDNVLYAKWKQLWTSGLSDIKPVESQQGSILYLMKYISKGATSKNVWKKCYSVYNASVKDSKVLPSTYTPAKSTNVSVPLTPTQQLCEQYKIKQMSWSRGFVFPILGTSSSYRVKTTPSGVQTLLPVVT